MRTPTAAAMLAAVVLTAGSPAPVGAAPPSCADLGGTISDGHICHISTSTNAYLLNLSYPTDYADEQALTDFLSQNRDGFINVAQTSGSRDMPYQMEVTAEQFRSGQPPHGTQSVMLKVFEDLGGPRPSTSFKGFNYDLGKGQPITFDNLFVAGSKPLDAIYPVVQRQLGQSGSGATVPPGSGLDPAHYQNFAITDDDVIFYFAPGELLPSSAGTSQVRVPRGALPPLTVQP